MAEVPSMRYCYSNSYYNQYHHQYVRCLPPPFRTLSSRLVLHDRPHDEDGLTASVGVRITAIASSWGAGWLAHDLVQQQHLWGKGRSSRPPSGKAGCRSVLTHQKKLCRATVPPCYRPPRTPSGLSTPIRLIHVRLCRGNSPSRIGQTRRQTSIVLFPRIWVPPLGQEGCFCCCRRHAHPCTPTPPSSYRTCLGSLSPAIIGPEGLDARQIAHIIHTAHRSSDRSVNLGVGEGEETPRICPVLGEKTEVSTG